MKMVKAQCHRLQPNSRTPSGTPGPNREQFSGWTKNSQPQSVASSGFMGRVPIQGDHQLEVAAVVDDIQALLGVVGDGTLT